MRQFPNVTNVDMSGTIAQVQRVLDQVIRAVEFLFGFTLATGLVVLFAAISATREARAREFAIMRSRASAALLRQVARAELVGVGLLWISGIGGRRRRGVGVGALTLSVRLECVAVAVGALRALAGAVLASLAGWWGLHEAPRRPVIEHCVAPQITDTSSGSPI